MKQQQQQQRMSFLDVLALQQAGSSEETEQQLLQLLRQASLQPSLLPMGGTSTGASTSMMTLPSRPRTAAEHRLVLLQVLDEALAITSDLDGGLDAFEASHAAGPHRDNTTSSSSSSGDFYNPSSSSLPPPSQ